MQTLKTRRGLARALVAFAEFLAKDNTFWVDLVRNAKVKVD